MVPAALIGPARAASRVTSGSVRRCVVRVSNALSAWRTHLLETCLLSGLFDCEGDVVAPVAGDQRSLRVGSDMTEAGHIGIVDACSTPRRWRGCASDQPRAGVPASRCRPAIRTRHRRGNWLCCKLFEGYSASRAVVVDQDHDRHSCATRAPPNSAQSSGSWAIQTRACSVSRSCLTV